MQNLKPIHLAAAVVIALSGASALAQTSGGTLQVAPRTGGTTTTSTTGTSTTAAPATGGCVGTAGSSCSVGTNTASSGSTANSTGTTPTPGVTANANTTQTTTPGSAGSSTGSGMGTNPTTVDPATTRPGSFEPGGAFGPPGANGTVTTPQGLNGNNAVVIPGEVGNPGQQNIVIQQPPAAQPEVRILSTPLLDQTTRAAQARETSRRNAKQEPRIIGIAPNTDRDLTNQMPDDPIIRY